MSSSGVNSTNILHTDFMRTNPRSAKKTYNFTVFFALLGSECIKAARKTLVKLATGVNFTNNMCILRAAFVQVYMHDSSVDTIYVCNFWA